MRTALLILCCLTPALVAAGDAPLRVYLPREMTVSAEQMSLADVAIVSSDDDALAMKAQAIAIGRGPWSGETIQIDRATVVSRLAASGIDKSRVELSGAPQVQVRRRETKVTAAQLTEAAETFLAARSPQQRWKLDGKVDDLFYPSDQQAKLSAALASEADGIAVVQVSVEVGGRSLATAKLSYRVGHEVTKVIATDDLPAGTPLTQRNTRLEKAVVFDKADVPAEPYGMAVRVAVGKGSEITAAMLQGAQPVVVVQRNQPVVMKIEGPGFLIRAAGIALQEGRVGQLIQVRNIDSKTIVVGKVLFDGTIEPITNEG